MLGYENHSAAFKARIILSEVEVQVEIWDDELTPVAQEGVSRSIRDWVKCHFDDYDHESFCEWLEISKEGVWEVLMEGTINGFWSGWETPEYDEDITVTKIQSQKLPDDWFGTPEPESKLGQFIKPEELPDWQKRCPKSPDGAHLFVFGNRGKTPTVCEYCGTPTVSNGESFKTVATNSYEVE